MSQGIDHRFVTEVPANLEAKVLYVAIGYATAAHLCPGCGRKVVTPFAPSSWRLTFDGEAISIHPSIWNRAHGCGSHYWIWGDRIVPASDPSSWHDRLAGRGPSFATGNLGVPSARKSWRTRLLDRLFGSS